MPEISLPKVDNRDMAYVIRYIDTRMESVKNEFWNGLLAMNNTRPLAKKMVNYTAQLVAASILRNMPFTSQISAKIADRLLIGRRVTMTNEEYRAHPAISWSDLFNLEVYSEK